MESNSCFNVNKIPVENKTPWDFDVVTKNYSLKQVWKEISYEINNKEKITACHLQENGWNKLNIN